MSERQFYDRSRTGSSMVTLRNTHLVATGRLREARQVAHAAGDAVDAPCPRPVWFLPVEWQRLPWSLSARSPQCQRWSSCAALNRPCECGTRCVGRPEGSCSQLMRVSWRWSLADGPGASAVRRVSILLTLGLPEPARMQEPRSRLAG